MSNERENLKGYKRTEYEEREDIAGEHKFSDIGQLIFLFCFLAIWGMDSFYLHFSTFLTEYIPIYVRAPIGGLILILAGYTAFKGLKQVFSEQRDPPEVIKTGVFAYVRHPVYSGAILFYLGMFFFTLSLLTLGFLFIIVFFYDFIASYEEELLIGQFEDDYKNYQKQVRKWLPRLGSRTEKKGN